MVMATAWAPVTAAVPVVALAVALEAVPVVVPEAVLEVVPEAVLEAVAQVAAEVVATTDAWSGTPRRAASATTATIPTITRASPVVGSVAKAVPMPLGRSLAAARVVTTR